MYSSIPNLRYIVSCWKISWSRNMHWLDPFFKKFKTASLYSHSQFSLSRQQQLSCSAMIVWEGVRSEAFAANTESAKLATAAKMTRKAQAPELETVNFPSRYCLGSSLFSFCTCPCNVRMLHMCGRVVMASKLFLNDKNSSRKLFALSCSVVII